MYLMVSQLKQELNFRLLRLRQLQQIHDKNLLSGSLDGSSYYPQNLMPKDYFDPRNEMMSSNAKQPTIESLLLPEFKSIRRVLASLLYYIKETKNELNITVSNVKNVFVFDRKCVILRTSSVASCPQIRSLTLARSKHFVHITISKIMTHQTRNVGPSCVKYKYYLAMEIEYVIRLSYMYIVISIYIWAYFKSQGHFGKKFF